MSSSPPARHRTHALAAARTLAALAALATLGAAACAPRVATPPDVPIAVPIAVPSVVPIVDDRPAATFDDTLRFLRYYAAPSRLDALRRVPVGERAAAWSDFLQATDPDPATPIHEGLQRYAARIQFANERYRGDGPHGWLTDRGTVFVALGEPDEVREPTLVGPGGREHVQVWVYRAMRVQLEFRDRAGFGRWLLTPRGQVEFGSVLTRLDP